MKPIHPDAYPDPSKTPTVNAPLSDEQLITVLRAENANLREDISNLEQGATYYTRRIAELEAIVRASYSDREKTLVIQLQAATKEATRARASKGATQGSMKILQTRHQEKLDKLQALFDGLLEGMSGFPPCVHDRSREKCIECLADWVRVKNKSDAQTVVPSNEST